MNRRTIIILSCVVYVAAMTSMFHFVEKYIEYKNNKLYQEITDFFYEVFEGEEYGGTYIDIIYTNKNIDYKKVDIPSKMPSIIHNGQVCNIDGSEEWDEKYGDIIKLYSLDIDQEYTKSNEGWRLAQIRFNPENKSEIILTELCPYAIGYTRNWDVPNINTITSDVLESMTTGSQKGIWGTLKQEYLTTIISKIKSYKNKYYYIGIEQSSFVKSQQLFNSGGGYYFGNEHYFREGGWLSGNGWRCYFAQTQPYIISIREKDGDPMHRNKISLQIVYSILITILFLLSIIPLWLKERQFQKISNENLYEVLCRVCHPSRFAFTKNYNKDKVDLANDIFKRIQNISPDNLELLRIIEVEAKEKLGIKIIDNELLDVLKKKVNPKQFVHPYNPEKLELANDLYNRLLKDDLTYSEYIDIRKKANILSNKTNENGTNIEYTTEDESV